MEVVRQNWTDERLDQGFERVDAELRAIRGEMASFRVETNARLDQLQRTLLQIGGGMLVGLMGIIATQL